VPDAVIPNAGCPGVLPVDSSKDVYAVTSYISYAGSGAGFDLGFGGGGSGSNSAFAIVGPGVLASICGGDGGGSAIGPDNIVSAACDVVNSVVRIPIESPFRIY
jgi:hypothetical protein